MKSFAQLAMLFLLSVSLHAQYSPPPSTGGFANPCTTPGCIILGGAAGVATAFAYPITYASPQTGADACAKITAAIAIRLAAGGGYVWADFTGAQTCAAGFTVPPTINLTVGPAQFTINAAPAVVVNEGAWLIGSGASASNNQTLFKLGNGVNGDVVQAVASTGTAAFWQEGRIEQIAIDGNKANNASGNGLNIWQIAENSTIRQVHIANAPVDAFRFNGSLAGTWVFEGNYYNAPGAYGMDFLNVSSTAKLFSVGGDNAGTAGVFIMPAAGGAFNISIVDSKFESATDPAILIDGTNSPTGIWIVNCLTNTTGTNFVKVQNATGAKIPSIAVVQSKLSYTNIYNDTTNGYIVPQISVSDGGGTLINLWNSGSLGPAAFQSIAFPDVGLTPVNGSNENFCLGPAGASYAGYARLTGPTAAFSIGGLSCQGTSNDGRLLVLQNTTSQTMTINNLDSGSTAGNRILTPTGGNVPIPGPGTATFMYDLTAGNWVMWSSGALPATPFTIGYPAAGVTASSLQTVPSEINAFVLSGADMCAKISAAWAQWAALPVSGGVVDARAFTGTQACAGDMWVNYPAGSGNDQFNGTLLLSPNVNMILSTTPTVVPGGAKILGNSGHPLGSPQFSQTGATIQPANGWGGGAVMQYGISRTNNPEGIWVQDLAVNCASPNGAFNNTSIGIQNKFAQENSGGDRVSIMGCETGLDVEPGGDDSGPWNNLHVTITGAADATAHCVDIGTSTVGSFSMRGIFGLSCVGEASGTQQNTGLYINGSNTVIESAHIEQFVTGIEIGNAHFVQGLTLSNIGCQGGATFAMTSCIDIASSGNPNGYFISNVRVATTGSGTPNILVDHVNGGPTIPGSEAALGFYGCGSQGMCYTTSASANGTRTSGDVVVFNSKGNPIDGGVQLSTLVPTGGTGGWSALTVTTFSSNATQYAPFAGGGLTNTTEATVQSAASATGTVSNLQVTLSASLGASTTMAVTLRIGGVSQILTCTTASAGTTCSDTNSAHAISVTQGNLIDWLLVTTGTVTSGLPQIQINYSINTVGAPTGSTFWIGPATGNSSNPMDSTINHITGRGFLSGASPVTFSNIYVTVNTQDAGADLYSVAIANANGTVLCHPTTASSLNFAAGTIITFPCSEGSVTMNGTTTYILLTTGNATTGTLDGTPANGLQSNFYSTNVTGCTSASGIISFATPCSISLTYGTSLAGGLPLFSVH